MVKWFVASFLTGGMSCFVCISHRSIHLSNNSVQKYFTSAPNRSDKLPAENMWTSDEFDEFLKFVSFARICELRYFNEICRNFIAVSYTHLTLPTNREV